MSISRGVSRYLLPVFLATSMPVAGADGVNPHNAQADTSSVVIALSPVWIAGIDEDRQRIDGFVKSQSNPKDFQVFTVDLKTYEIRDDKGTFGLSLTFNLGALESGKWIAQGSIDCSYKKSESSAECLWIVVPYVGDLPVLKKSSDDGLLNQQRFPIDSGKIDWKYVQQVIDKKESLWVKLIVEQHSTAHVAFKGQIPAWLQPGR